MLVDLPDDRRGNKPWLPADDRDVTSGLVAADVDGKPSCYQHGAMNRVDPHRGVWRCSEYRCGVGAELIPARVDRRSGYPAYKQIADQLRADIACGKITERLPSEAQLMACYQVSRMTVRNAIHVLWDERLIYTAPGRGVYVMRHPR